MSARETLALRLPDVPQVAPAPSDAQAHERRIGAIERAQSAARLAAWAALAGVLSDVARELRVAVHLLDLVRKILGH